MIRWQQEDRQGKIFSSIRGAIAGAIGTVPMTLFMLAMHRLLPRWQRYALPPEEITREVAERNHVQMHMTKQRLLGITLISHFGYGASMGSLYGILIGPLSFVPVFKGALFGLAVWAASYLGWLPAANFPVAAPEEPLRRNILMIVAHLLWGATTAIVDDVLKD